MALHLNHRPTSFDDVVGNLSVVESLRSLLNRDNGDRPRAFLFHGPSGCGKTTLARIAAAEFGCREEDISELDVGDFRGIDTIREVRKQMYMRPIAGEARAWILDECHQLSKDAQNALLKSLEDTPKHVYFFLATTDPQKLLKTIRSRCTAFQVEELSDKKLLRLMMKVVKAEGKKVARSALDKIAESAAGSPRQALVMLDKVIDMSEEQQQAVVDRIGDEESQVIDICRDLLKRASWKVIAPKIKSVLETQEPESVRRMILGYFTTILLNKGDANSYVILDCFKEPYFNSGKAGLVLSCYEALEQE